METAIQAANVLLLVGTGLALGAAVWLMRQSLPRALSAKLADWEGRIAELETGWTRVKGELAVQLEAMEELDEKLGKKRARITAENRRAEVREAGAQFGQVEPGSPEYKQELRRRAGMI